MHCCCWVAKLCLALCNPVNCSPQASSVHGISPGKNTRVGCCFLLQGIFPTQWLKLHLLHLLHWCSLIHVQLLATPWTVALLCPRGFPGKNTEWVSMPSSRGSSQPRGWIWDSCVSYIVCEFFMVAPPGKSKYVHTVEYYSVQSHVTCDVLKHISWYDRLPSKLGLPWWLSW